MLQYPKSPPKGPLMQLRSLALLLLLCTLHAVPESTFDNNTQKSPKVDSGICKNASNLTTPQAEGFCDDFVSFQAIDKGATLAVVTTGDRAESSKSAQNQRSAVSLENQAKLNRLQHKICFTINSLLKHF